METKYFVALLILLMSLPLTNITAQNHNRRSTPVRSSSTPVRSRSTSSKQNKRSGFLQILEAPSLSKKNKDEKSTINETKEKKDTVQTTESMSISNTLKKQDSKDVQLIVTGDGETIDQAKQTALRNAVEHFGTVVSSHTEIQNDSLVKDEVASVTSGFLKDIEWLSEDIVDGKYTVSAKVMISTGNLIDYTTSKGNSAELAGYTFAMEMRIQELNKQNEIKVIDHLISQLAKFGPSLFKFSPILGNPQKSKNQYKCSLEITCAISNATAVRMYDLLISTLNALSMSKSEYEQYCALGMDGYEIKLYDINRKPYQTYYFRNDYTYAFGTLKAWLSYCSRNFKLKDDFGEYIYEFVPSPTRVLYNEFYPEKRFKMTCDYIKLTDKGNRALSCGSIGKEDLFFIQENRINNASRGNIMEGYITFSDLDIISKFSRINIIGVSPKLSFTDFKTTVVAQPNK